MSIASGLWPQGWEEPVRYDPGANHYIAHRMTIPVGFDKVACDCGEPFDTATDLERHQQRYRHPGISSGWDGYDGDTLGGSSAGGTPASEAG